MCAGRVLPVLPVLAGLRAGARPGPGAERAAELVRIVRQDCGSCHGMRLTGGLGPALTREALADKPARRRWLRPSCTAGRERRCRAGAAC